MANAGDRDGLKAVFTEEGGLPAGRGALATQDFISMFATTKTTGFFVFFCFTRVARYLQGSSPVVPHHEGGDQR